MEQDKPDANQQTNIDDIATRGSEFDPRNLTLPQDFGGGSAVTKALLTIPVRKPNRHEFIRVKPGEENRLEVAVLELKEERETYLIAPQLVSTLGDEVSRKVLRVTMNRQGVLTLWPIKLPGADGRLDNWSHSALQAAEIAETRWVRIASNMSLGAYDVYPAAADIPEPEWPDRPLEEILRVAFTGRLVTALDHPVIQRLYGKV
ncbi:hypothetical protein [Haliea sp. E17]|uniref:hypothetical protein n=1 Tax=Haliea sp. E17 TaxID=3401576 RepID=UPI003AAE72CE